MFYLTRDQARELDRRAVEEFGLPSIVLMENAGRGVAEKLCELGIDGLVVICCGPGNNGGDGFVIARHLDLRGFAVKVFAWGWDEAAKIRPGDAQVNFEVIRHAGIPLLHRPDFATLTAELKRAAWIVDALLGTGSRGEPRSPLDIVIDLISSSGRPVMAVDLPSGLDCDEGEAAMHTVLATHTCTFVAPKIGFVVPGVAKYLGQVHVVDIGAPRRLVEQVLKSSG